MPAAITDKLTRASSGAAPLPTNLSAQKNIGVGSLSLVAATGWPTATAVHFLLYKVNTSGAVVAGSITGWKGTLSGTTVSNLTLQFGTDDVYVAGSSVIAEVAATSAWADDLITGLLVSHNQDGTMITSLPLTTPKVTTSINDANGNEVIKTPATTSATNEITVTNAANGTAPKISSTGSSDTNVNLNLIGKGTGSVQINGTDVLNGPNFIVSGCVWTADSAGVNRNASMSSGVVMIGGNILTVAAVTARTFTASQDTYVDFADNGDGTASITYSGVVNNNASPALANSGTTANTIRNAIVVAGVGNIASSASINQGQQGALLPIASSVAYTITDSLGNLICPRDPNSNIIGYREVATGTNFIGAASAAQQDVTGLTAMPVIVPTGRSIRITAVGDLYNSTSASGVALIVKEGASLIRSGLGSNVINGPLTVVVPGVVTPTVGLHTYKVAIQTAAGTPNVQITASEVPYIMAELV